MRLLPTYPKVVTPAIDTPEYHSHEVRVIDSGPTYNPPLHYHDDHYHSYHYPDYLPYYHPLSVLHHGSSHDVVDAVARSMEKAGDAAVKIAAAGDGKGASEILKAAGEAAKVAGTAAVQDTLTSDSSD